MRTVDFGNGIGPTGTFDTSTGKVLITARWAKRYSPTLVYEVYAEIPASEFFKFMDIPTGNKSAEDISDLMVNAFDCDIIYDNADKFGLANNDRFLAEGCLYVYETVGGEFISQHST